MSSGAIERKADGEKSEHGSKFHLIRNKDADNSVPRHTGKSESGDWLVSEQGIVDQAR
jgi:hypothetical protein